MNQDSLYAIGEINTVFGISSSLQTSYQILNLLLVYPFKVYHVLCSVYLSITIGITPETHFRHSYCALYYCVLR